MLLIGIVLLNVATAALPSPYNELEELLPYNPQGWFHNGPQIENLMRTYKVRTIIEVGSWMGQSTIHMASLLPKKGKLYAVDHWQGSTEHQSDGPCATPLLPKLYEQFLSNIIHTKLTKKSNPNKNGKFRSCKQT